MWPFDLYPLSEWWHCYIWHLDNKKKCDKVSLQVLVFQMQAKEQLFPIYQVQKPA